MMASTGTVFSPNARIEAKPSFLIAARTRGCSSTAPALLDPAALEQAVHLRFPRRKGSLLAVCPDETIVLYTLGNRADAVELHDAAAHLAAQAPQPVSTQVMEWSHGAWQPVP